MRRKLGFETILPIFGIQSSREVLKETRTKPIVTSDFGENLGKGSKFISQPSEQNDVKKTTSFIQFHTGSNMLCLKGLVGLPFSRKQCLPYMMIHQRSPKISTGIKGWMS